MKITVICHRKAYPQEILFQLEPVLRKAGLRWWDIIGLLQEELKEKGFKVREITKDYASPNEDDDLSYLCITDEKAEPIDESRFPYGQLFRPSELIREDDGSYRQGFRLHSRGWHGVKPVETLFVPDDHGFGTGELVECHYDTKQAVWRPSGKTERVAAAWNVVSAQEDAQRPMDSN